MNRDISSTGMNLQEAEGCGRSSKCSPTQCAPDVWDSARLLRLVLNFGSFPSPVLFLPSRRSREPLGYQDYSIETAMKNLDYSLERILSKAPNRSTYNKLQQKYAEFFQYNVSRLRLYFGLLSHYSESVECCINRHMLRCQCWQQM